MPTVGSGPCIGGPSDESIVPYGFARTAPNRRKSDRRSRGAVTPAPEEAARADAADEELAELVELEVRELLASYGYPGEDVPVALDAGQAFAIREGGRTVGAGTVTTVLN
jgi:Elongation factor Tu C-terminal domain